MPLNRRSFLKRSVAITAGLHLTDRRARAGELSTAPVDVGLSPSLFLDDAVVERLDGLERKFHQPTKAGLIQEADGQPWQRGDQLAVVRDPAGQFHMVYRFAWEDPSVRTLHPGIGDDKAHWFRASPAYATSQDGIRWTKPVLRLADGPTGFRPAPKEKWADGVFQEPVAISRQNNLGYPMQMTQDLAQFGGIADPRRRYLINVMLLDDTHNFAKITDSGLYFSDHVPDIVGDPAWRRRLEPIWEDRRRGPRGPAVRVAGYDARERNWFECAQSAFGRWTKGDGRTISRWTSADLKSWSDEELVLPIAADESRDPAHFIEYMDIRVIRVADFWLGQLITFDGDRTSSQYEMPTHRGVWRKGTTQMRLVMSRDAGRTWSRVGGQQAWIPSHDDEHGFDRLVFTGSPVRVGDELWLYYGCWDGDHLVWNRDGTTYYKDRARIPRTARAVLRFNGFVSLHAGATAGQLQTKPLKTSGTRLELNAAVADGGKVRVALETTDGRPIAAHALDNCVSLTGSGVSQSVRWTAGADISKALSPGGVRLRIELRDADLYGFQLVG